MGISVVDFKRIYIIHNDHDVQYRLIREALSRIDSTELRGQSIIDFGKVIGYSNLVEVTEDEAFYYEVRGNRPYPSRFVLNRLPVPCTKLAIVWERKSTELIYVITAYFTESDYPSCPDEPGNVLRKMKLGVSFTPDQIQESLNFWSTHAFVEPIPLNY